VSKKKFSEGLESLFDESLGDAFERNNPLLEEKPKPAKPTKTRKKRSSGKTFTSDFNALFEETLRETVQEKAKAINKKNAADATKRRSRKPMSGLDMLIRRTVESSEMDFEPGTKRRVTFVFEEEKIEQLKKTARVRKSYLKEIMNELVEEYIQRYEQKLTDR